MVSLALALACRATDVPTDSDVPAATDDTEVPDTDVPADTDETDVPDTDVPSDLDGDGHDRPGVGGDDCDDADPSVHPGGTQACSGKDEDCDGRAWGPGPATWVDATGRTDLTALLADPAVPVTLATDGELLLCAGTFGRIVITANVGVYGFESPAMDGGDAGTVVSVHGDGLAVDLEDVALRNGVGEDAALAAYGLGTAGGAIACVGDSAVSLRNVTASGTAGTGGAIAAAGCSVSIVDGALDGTATQGGAIAAVDADLSLSGTTVTGTATTGGAIYALAWDRAPTVTITGSDVTGAARDGGGLAFVASGSVPSSLAISASDLSGTATRDGGALYLSASASIGGLRASLADSTVSASTAASGGGIYADGPIGRVDLDLVDVTLSGNTAETGGGLAARHHVHATCTGGRTSAHGFFANEATTGGAAWLDDAATLESDTCDWGSPGTSDDNTGPDVYSTDGYHTWPFEYGADQSFACAEMLCGTSATADIGGTADETDTSGVSIGNIYTWDGPATLTEFASWVDYDADCSNWAGILSRPTGATGDWTVVTARKGVETRSGVRRIQSTSVIALEEGTDYALVTGNAGGSCAVTTLADDTLTATGGFAALTGSWVEPRATGYTVGAVVTDHSSTTILAIDQEITWLEP
jgi:hypothetical protein